MLAKFAGLWFSPIDWRMHVNTATAYAVIDWAPMIVLGIVALKWFHVPRISISGDAPLIRVTVSSSLRRTNAGAAWPATQARKKRNSASQLRRMGVTRKPAGNGVKSKFRGPERRRKAE